MSEKGTTPDQPKLVGYEAPRVERVLTPAEIEREILYAGDEASVVDNPI